MAVVITSFSGRKKFTGANRANRRGVPVRYVAAAEWVRRNREWDPSPAANPFSQNSVGARPSSVANALQAPSSVTMTPMMTKFHSTRVLSVT